MKWVKQSIPLMITIILTIGCAASGVCAQEISAGMQAPMFSLKDSSGQSYDLSVVKDSPMSILYFFDTESTSSQEGLLSLDKLGKKYKNADLSVWGITASGKNNVMAFINRNNPGFPILLDQRNVSARYNATVVLPTVCIIGPGLKILDVFQGGGKTTEIMLVRLAERKLQHKNLMMAKVISEEVAKKNPDNINARSVQGYAALKEGNLNEAETVFKSLAGRNDNGEVVGKEGLAAVYAGKGETEKAMGLVREVETKAPDRSYVQVVKGDILYSQNKKNQAETAYKKAVANTVAEPFQKARSYNKLGRYYASTGRYNKSRELYDKAISIDPYYIEATSNKGMTYEKEGNWDQALASYRDALKIDKNDTFAAVLARKAEEMIAVGGDAEKKKHMDKLIRDLAERYRKQKKSASRSDDDWTSRPMIVTFIDFQEKGGLSERDGISEMLTTQLGNMLNSSGRIQVVERVMLERLLEELNLGSSDLADPETALKLGKVLAAKIIGTGSLLHLSNATLMNLRLIDTETSAIPKVITKQIILDIGLEKELKIMNRDILKAIVQKYPLQGFIVAVSDQEADKNVMINLGSKQGVTLGTRFSVIEEKEPVTYKGKKLHSQPEIVGEINVVKVEPNLAYAQIIHQKRSLKQDDKIVEKIDELVAMGKADVDR